MVTLDKKDLSLEETWSKRSKFQYIEMFSTYFTRFIQSSNLAKTCKYFIIKLEIQGASRPSF